MSEQVMTWRGKLLTDMTREELIEAVQWLGRQYAEDNSPYMLKAKSLGRTRILADHGITSGNYRR